MIIDACYLNWKILKYGKLLKNNLFLFFTWIGWSNWKILNRENIFFFFPEQCLFYEIFSKFSVQAGSSRFQPVPAGSSQFQPVPAGSSRRLQGWNQKNLG